MKVTITAALWLLSLATMAPAILVPIMIITRWSAGPPVAIAMLWGLAAACMALAVVINPWSGRVLPGFLWRIGVTVGLILVIMGLRWEAPNYDAWFNRHVTENQYSSAAFGTISVRNYRDEGRPFSGNTLILYPDVIVPGAVGRALTPDEVDALVSYDHISTAYYHAAPKLTVTNSYSPGPSTYVNFLLFPTGLFRSALPAPRTEGQARAYLTGGTIVVRGTSFKMSFPVCAGDVLPAGTAASRASPLQPMFVQVRIRNDRCTGSPDLALAETFLAGLERQSSVAVDLVARDGKLVYSLHIPLDQLQAAEAAATTTRARMARGELGPPFSPFTSYFPQF